MKTFVNGLCCPLGWLIVKTSQDEVLELSFSDLPPPAENSNSLMEKTLLQLKEFFLEKRPVFELPLNPAGTGFQQAVWRQLRLIPFGEVMSYGQVAAALGTRGAARAVGRACHANPLALIIPCHRVVGANGSLTGFGGGIWRKRWLLDHERAYGR